MRLIATLLTLMMLIAAPLHGAMANASAMSRAGTTMVGCADHHGQPSKSAPQKAMTGDACCQAMASTVAALAAPGRSARIVPMPRLPILSDLVPAGRPWVADPPPPRG